MDNIVYEIPMIVSNRFLLLHHHTELIANKWIQKKRRRSEKKKKYNIFAARYKQQAGIIWMNEHANRG